MKRKKSKKRSFNFVVRPHTTHILYALISYREYAKEYTKVEYKLYLTRLNHVDINVLIIDTRIDILGEFALDVRFISDTQIN